MVSVLGRPDTSAAGFEEPRAQYEAIVDQLAALPPKDAERVRAAMDAAWQLHDGQVRTSTTVPYITHPLSNLQRLLDYGVTDPDMLAAAALHDCVEDCSGVYAEKVGADASDPAQARDVTQRSINQAFGPGVGDIVAAVSNDLHSDVSLSSEEKDAQYLAHARAQIAAHVGSFMVKYADFLDNAGTLEEAEFADPDRKSALARKYLPLADAFGEVAAEHARAGDLTLSSEGRAELDRELVRIKATLASILSG